MSTGRGATHQAGLADLDLPQLAARLCWITVHGARADRAHPANRARLGVDRPIDAVTELAPGGLVLFAFSGNCEHPDQLAALLADLQEAAAGTAGGLPLGVAIDEEGGRVTRLGPPVTTWPSARALARGASPEQARARWRAAGRELASIGISVNLAPVADVGGSTAHASPVVGERAFSDDPDAVADHAAAAVAGLGEGGVAAVAKHFPGHGATTTDSHVGLPRVALDRDALEAGHLRPFRRLIAERAADPVGHRLPGVMPAHLLVEALDADRPVTLSPAALTDLLRGEMGFDGAVVSDSLAMGALADRDPAAVAVEAVAAGVDVLLCPPDPRAAVAALVDAVEAGRLSANRLADAARRGHALASAGPPADAGAVPWAEHRRMAGGLAARAVAVHDADGRLPLRAGPLVCGGRGAGRLATALRDRGCPADLLDLAEPAGDAGGLADAGQAAEPPLGPDAGERAGRAPSAEAVADLAGRAEVVVVVDSDATGARGKRDAVLARLAGDVGALLVDVGCGSRSWPARGPRLVAYGADAAVLGAVADRLAGH